MEDIQQAIAVLAVLGILGASLYWLRTRGLITFASKGMRAASGRRLEHIERMPLTAQHSLHLVRVAGRVVLIAVSPGACCLLENTGVEAMQEEGRIVR